MVRHTLSVKLLLEAHDILRSWHPTVKRCDVVPGNHDQIDTLGRNALEVFDNLEGFHVHTKPTWTTFGFMLPWLHDAEEAARVIQIARDKQTPTSKASALFAHLAVNGAWMNNLRKNTDGVSVDLLAGWKRVFLGHYHRHQMVRKGVFYVGSPYEVTYAEAGQPKGYMHFAGGKVKFHQLDIGPKHHKFVIDADHPEDAVVPADLGPRDKLWVQVKGQAGGVLSGHVTEILRKAGVEADRIEVELKAGDTLDDLALQYLEAQDMDQDYKALLAETFRRLR